MNADGSDEHQISDFGDEPDWQPLTTPVNEPPPSVLGFDAEMYLAIYPNKPQVKVTRSGNLEQAVSCNYRTYKTDPSFTDDSHGGSLSFAPGELSKTIDFSSDYGTGYKISLGDNGGNATFVGGN